MRHREKVVNRLRKKEGKPPLPPFNSLTALPKAIEEANEMLLGDQKKGDGR